MIRVNEQEIKFKPGMTAADALKETGNSVGSMTLIMVDERVLSFDQVKNEVLTDGAHIKTLTIVSGG